MAESGIRPHCGQIIYSSSVSRGQILFSVCFAQFDLFNQWVVTGDSRRPGPWHHVLTTRGLELPNGTLLMEDYTLHSHASFQEATVTMFSGHVIVAIFADGDSPLLGLR